MNVIPLRVELPCDCEPSPEAARPPSAAPAPKDERRSARKCAGSLQADIEAMELAARGGEEFIANMKHAPGVGDRGAEHSTKRNLMGWS